MTQIVNISHSPTSPWNLIFSTFFSRCSSEWVIFMWLCLKPTQLFFSLLLSAIRDIHGNLNFSVMFSVRIFKIFILSLSLCLKVLYFHLLPECSDLPHGYPKVYLILPTFEDLRVFVCWLLFPLTIGQTSCLQSFYVK